FGQLARAEVPPPVDRRDGRLRRDRLARAIDIGRREIERPVRPVARQQGAAEGQSQAQTLQHDPKRAHPNFCTTHHKYSYPSHTKSLSKPGHGDSVSTDTTPVCRWRAYDPAASWPRPVCQPGKSLKRLWQKCPESSDPTSIGPPESSPSPRALPQRRTVPG